MIFGIVGGQKTRDLREVPPVFFRSVEIGKDARVVHRQLESVIKISSDDGSGSLREIFLQKFGEKAPAEQDRVPPPPFERRDHERCAVGRKTLNQGPDRIRREERMVHRGEKDGRSFIGQ